MPTPARFSRGRCSMCAVTEDPVNGRHYRNGRWCSCGNEDKCSLCVGCLPPGEQCRACGRINKREVEC